MDDTIPPEEKPKEEEEPQPHLKRATRLEPEPQEPQEPPEEPATPPPPPPPLKRARRKEPQEATLRKRAKKEPELPPPPLGPEYWASLVQTHKMMERARQEERWGNLSIM